MGEEEIDLWYEEEKQKLSELYMKSIEKGMSLDRREKKFDSAMERLNLRYERRHRSLQRKKENRKVRKKILSALWFPFKVMGRGLIRATCLVGRLIRQAFKARCANMHFHASVAWIRNSHKITDTAANTSRRFYFFYVKHLQAPLMALAKPFVKTGKAIKKTVQNTSRAVSTSASKAWRRIVAAVKLIAKTYSAVAKNVSARRQEIAKRYHEQESKRVQAHLDKKQKKKEEKEKKLKAKHEKSGQAAEAPAEAANVALKQAPDAEATA
ncbi:hypothetical protein JW898_00805 [Candidatus Woesearchaeota archaeon]|nr:hypothetical protein [Candidatus Woesearchaeota archaeon]